PLTLGATLILIYRVKTTALPLSAVVLYDGAFAPGNASQNMNQTIQGFYQAAVSAPPVAKITHIVGNGQTNKSQAVYFNSQLLPSLYAGQTPFPGFYNSSWDNPTWAPNQYGSLVNSNDSTAATTVVPSNTNKGCTSWTAIVFKVNVQDSDHDGLLDVWKKNHGYNDTKDGAFVGLPGAASGQKDVFIQVDYLKKAGAGAHSHLPKLAALDKIGNAFLARGIHLHFDVG